MTVGLARPTGAPAKQSLAPVLVFALILALTASVDLLTVWQYRSGTFEPFGFAFECSVAALAYGGLGALISVRAPGNRMGQLMIALGLAAAAQGFFGALGALSDGLGWTSWVTDVLSALSSACQRLFVGGVVVALLLAPTGRPLTKRWRAVVALSAAGAVAVALDALLFGGTDGGVQVGLAASILRGLLAVVGMSVLLGLVSAPLCLGLRWRRARGLERQQVVWVAAGGLAGPGIVILGGSLDSAGVLPVDSIDAWVHGSTVWGLAGAALPTGIAIAILRHRLYDIDRLIGRTLSYAMVTGVLIATYAVVVTAVGELLPVSSSLAVAVATLTSAALFRPLLLRVRTAVDRRFNRSRYDAQRTVEEFGRRLRDEVDPDEVTADLLAVLGRTIQPTVLSLWQPPRKS